MDSSSHLGAFPITSSHGNGISQYLEAAVLQLDFRMGFTASLNPGPIFGLVRSTLNSNYAI
jgi:hypothetical protein